MSGSVHLAMAHPYGVLPLEAMEALGVTNAVRDAGLGRGRKGLAQLSDELLMAILGNLGAKDLAVLSTVSKALSVFCNTDDLYKGLLLEVRFKGHTAYATIREAFFFRAQGANSRR